MTVILLVLVPCVNAMSQVYMSPVQEHTHGCVHVHVPVHIRTVCRCCVYPRVLCRGTEHGTERPCRSAARLAGPPDKSRLVALAADSTGVPPATFILFAPHGSLVRASMARLFVVCSAAQVMCRVLMYA